MSNTTKIVTELRKSYWWLAIIATHMIVLKWVWCATMSYLLWYFKLFLNLDYGTKVRSTHLPVTYVHTYVACVPYSIEHCRIWALLAKTQFAHSSLCIKKNWNLRTTHATIKSYMYMLPHEEALLCFCVALMVRICVT